MSESFDVAGAWPPAVLPSAFEASQNVTTLRVATAGYASRASDAPASTIWAPRIVGDVEISLSAMDRIALGGDVALGISAIDLFDGDNWSQDMDRYGTADGRAALIRVVDVTSRGESDFGTALAAARTSFRGIVGGLGRAANQHATIQLADASERLNVPLQSSLYLGTGGIEGGTDLATKPKPVALGRCYNLAPVALGNVDLGVGSLPTYQSHWRSITAHDAVRIRGVAQTATGGTPVLGQFRDFPSQGMFQLGSAPDGDVTADVRGDNVGGYVNTSGTVLRRLLGSLGPGLGDADFDGVAMAFAEVDLPGEIGWCQGATPTTAINAATAIAAGAAAVIAGSRDGTLRLFDPIASDIPQFTLAASNILSCAPAALPAQLKPTPFRVQIGYQRNWAPIATPANSVPATERQRLAGAVSIATSTSGTVTLRVAQQVAMQVDGLYYAAADAQARADKWTAWLAGGPRSVTVITDRYLDQINLGTIGRITYPGYGLDAGFTGVVVGLRETIGARRVELTVIGIS